MRSSFGWVVARCALVIGLASPVAASRIDAQTLRGTVTLADRATPVGGAIVVARDAQGVNARALTARTGTFIMRLPHAGTFDLTVLRIGFRPTKAPPVTVAAGRAESIALVANSDPISLSAVNVRANKDCRVNPDTGLMVARVWDEARKAMFASQLSAGDANAAPLDGEWIEYERLLDASARIVRRQSVRSSSHPTTHAFKSLSADILARDGYVVSDDSTTSFYAPDADVLLSDRFAATHCLRLEGAPAGKANLIGVAFAPTRDRRGTRDIEGTLWLDRASAELRTLEFRYTDLPDLAIAAGAGGHVDFLRLDGVTWLVNEWAIRFPRLKPRDRVAENGARKLTYATENLELRDIQITGGQVTRVGRGADVMYEWVGPHLALQLVSHDPTIAVGGAELSLDGTDYRAVADAAGNVRLSPVLAGTYVARVHLPLLDSLGIPPLEREVVARFGTRVDSLTVMLAEEVLRKACPPDSTKHAGGMLRGTVRDAHGNPLANAVVTATWQSRFYFGAGQKVDNLGYHEATIGAMTGADGQWRLCGVPRGLNMSVRVSADSGTDVRRVGLPESNAFTTVDLVAHTEAQVALPRDWRESAFVELVVTTAAGAPLPDATLDVTAPGGLKRSLRTGVSGRALVPDVRPGVLVVQARRVGFTPGTLALTVQSGRNTASIMLSENAAPQLDTVRVLGGKKVTRRLDEFETRRVNHAASASITRADIEKRHSVDAWQLLLDVPSVRVTPTGQGVFASSARGRAPSLGDPSKPCVMSVVVDGTPLVPRGDNGVDLNELPRPEEIYGIEVFAGAARIPLQYGSSGGGKWCGLIAIWTRAQ
jgi:hypothetical protein